MPKVCVVCVCGFAQFARSVNYICDVVPDVSFELQFAVTASIQLSICSNSNVCWALLCLANKF